MEILALGDRFDTKAPRLSLGSENISAWIDAGRGDACPVFTVQQYMGGRQWKDFVWTRAAGAPLISERVRDLLRKNRITGWTTFPVTVLDAAGNEIPSYAGLAITGRCGGRIGFDRRESALIYKPSATGKQMPWFRSLHFDPSTWDGSDLFMDSAGSGWKLVTERVAQLFKSGKVSNCVLEDIGSIETLAIEAEIIKGQ